MNGEITTAVMAIVIFCMFCMVLVSPRLKRLTIKILDVMGLEVEMFEKGYAKKDNTKADDDATTIDPACPDEEAADT